jgi:hypothetical protein
MRCPLTVKFGKDVAGLIWRMLWQSFMKAVNNEYHLLFTWLETSRSCYLVAKQININNRHPHANYLLVYNMRGINVAWLPKNYWEIKELY